MQEGIDTAVYYPRFRVGNETPIQYHVVRPAQLDDESCDARGAEARRLFGRCPRLLEVELVVEQAPQDGLG